MNWTLSRQTEADLRKLIVWDVEWTEPFHDRAEADLRKLTVWDVEWTELFHDRAEVDLR
jgi:hypothetical protein